MAHYEVELIARIYLTYEVEAEDASEAKHRAVAAFEQNEEPAKAEDYGELIRIDRVVAQ
jgi:hypothetical protein